MSKITAIIEKGDSEGYSIYAEKDEPLFSSGETEEEAKAEFLALIPEQAEYIRQRRGKYPDWYGAEVEFRYDMSGFFQAFPFINASELARYIGINPSLMRKYKSGIKKAGEKQKDLIQQKFDEIVSRLSLVRF